MVDELSGGTKLTSLPTQKPVQKLESKEDLELLMVGDVIELKETKTYNLMYKSPITKAVYFGKNINKHLRFLVVVDPKAEAIIEYRIHPHWAELSDGIISLNMECTAIEAYNSKKPEYEIFNKLVTECGLRQ